MIALVANRVTIPPAVQPPDGRETAETPDPEQLLAGFAVLGEVPAETTNGQRRREKT
ncbi:hypothetical protein OHA46_00390 [Streptomyces sp. NBC_00708]